jgi:multidrug efflux pump subunit AcrB
VVLAALNDNARARAGDIDAITEETISCSRHILSTTLTTIAGFIPLILLVGGQFWPPLAVVIAGGVGLSIILSLWFTPSVYKLWIGRGDKKGMRTKKVALPDGNHA